MSHFNRQRSHSKQHHRFYLYEIRIETSDKQTKDNNKNNQTNNTKKKKNQKLDEDDRIRQTSIVNQILIAETKNHQTRCLPELIQCKTKQHM